MLFLAQAAQAAPDWEKWVAIFAGIAVLQTVFQPLIGYLVKDILLGRLIGVQATSELKLSLMGQTLGRIETDVREVKNELKKVQSDGTQMKLETQGDLGELERQIEREFVRKQEHKDDIEKLRTLITDQYAELSRQLHEALKGRR